MFLRSGSFGPHTGHCVVFFAGHGGGFLRYARELFPSLTSAGLQVWAISYPGQDGAPGRASRLTVLFQIQGLLAAISKQCPREQTVFLGRSLGGNVAAIAAASWRPRGLVLEGAAASLAIAVRHRLSSHWFTRLLEVLPIESLVAPDFPLAASVAQFGANRTILFQGQLDEVAPVADLEPLRRLGVTLHVVANATHSNAYLLAGPFFISSLARWTGADVTAIR